MIKWILLVAIAAIVFGLLSPYLARLGMVAGIGAGMVAGIGAGRSRSARNLGWVS